jgi:ribonucleotide monophosphatase NagD (HAD superfamily)
VGGAELVAMHRNKYWQKTGGLHVDIGAFVAGLEYVADVEATITGKPSAAFFDAAVASLGVKSANVVLVGDDIQSDIGGAQSAGLRAALVATGKYRPDLVAQSGIVPDWQLASIADLESILW